MIRFHNVSSKRDTCSVTMDRDRLKRQQNLQAPVKTSIISDDGARYNLLGEIVSRQLGSGV